MRTFFSKKKDRSLSTDVVDKAGQVLLDQSFIDTKKPIRRGFLILVLGFGGFILFASLAPIDSGVPTVGNLTVESSQKVIQHLTGGIVEEVRVRDGDLVKKDQVLIKIQPNITMAQVGIYRAQANYLSSKLHAVSELVKDGYFPRMEYLELQRQALEAEEKLKIAKEELDRVEIRSPIDGYVLGLAISTVGGVITPGGKIMNIVPQNDSLVVEAIVPQNLVDKVLVGLRADVRFAALNQRITPVVEGQVVWVSADKISDPNQASSVTGHYIVRIALNPEAFEMLSSYQLRAGIPVDVVIKTGSRTFMSYLIRPLFDRVALSMKEM